MIKSSPIPKIEYRDLSAKIHDRSSQSDRVIKAQMELTYKCNLHCLHCYTDPYNRPEYFSKELTFEEITRILDEMADLGILWLTFTGGEVFMRKDFLKIYDYAWGKGFVLSIFANGTMFTDFIVEHLKQKPPFLIDISIHTVNEERFDWFTKVPGSFKRFVEGLRKVKQSGLRLLVKTKAMTWNQDELSEVRSFVESMELEFGFTSTLFPCLNGDLGPLAYRLNADHIRVLETEQRVWIENEETCYEARQWVASPSDQMYRCGCATNTIHISAWGELGACTLEYEARASLREHSLKDAIDKVFTQIRSLKYQTNSACRSCQIYAFCDKSVTTFRWENQDREQAIRHYCDTAVDRAERLMRMKLNHPLKNINSTCHSDPP